MSDLRYPIGDFKWTKPESEEQSAKDRVQYIDVLAKLPVQMRTAVQGLSAEQLDTPYRPEGWTVRQVVHHVPESHMNAYIRFKLALTETQPQIKPYNEAAWAQLPDNSVTPVKPCDRPILDAHCLILNAACSRLIKCWRCIRGTPRTTWPTSHLCANAWVGSNAPPQCASH
jgi:hypothetical protein